MLSLVESPDDAYAFHLWVTQLPAHLPVGLDTETNGQGRARDQVLRMVQFGTVDEGYAVPADQYRGHIAHALTVLAARGNPVGIHNAMFDLDVLQSAGLPLPARHQTYDTMLLALHEDNTRPAGLKELSTTLTPHLPALDKKLSEVWKRSRWTWADIPLDHPVYWRYAAYDPIACARLLTEQLTRPHPAYADDFTFNEVLRAAYRRGISVDHEFREPALFNLDTQADLIESDLANLGISNPGMADVGARIEELTGLTLPRTRRGAVSTSKDALSQFDHAVLDLLITWRSARNEATKVRTWLDCARLRPVLRPWSKDPDSDKARTGRASTVDPNLQAFTGAHKGPLRNCLVPDEGQRFVAIDYDNQELRLIAHFTQDPELRAAFEQGLDIHTHVAEMIGAPRAVAKTLDFALPYGAGEDKLAATVGCTIGEMRDILRRLAREFPGMAGFVEAHVGQASLTLGGRTVYPDPDRPYTGGNYRIQGSGADVLKTAVSRLEAAGYAECIVASVHDEILFTFPEEEAECMTHEVSSLMERDDTDPPLSVSSSPPVARWGEAK